MKSIEPEKSVNASIQSVAQTSKGRKGISLPSVQNSSPGFQIQKQVDQRTQLPEAWHVMQQKKVQTASLQPVLQRAKYTVSKNKEVIPELNKDDQAFIDTHRATRDEVLADDEYKTGSKKGSEYEIDYKGIKVTVRYDKSKNGEKVYPRIYVNETDLTTKKLAALAEAATDQVSFFKGLRGIVEAPVKKKKKGETTPKEKSPDYIKGLEVRATLLGSDTLDFATEKITASILSTVDNVEDYQKLFQTGRRESSFGGLLSQNTHNALEASQDRIGPYNQFGKLISGTAKKGTLTLDDELVTHVPLFRKLRSLLSLEPKRYIIKNEEGEIITTETFIKIADAVFLRQRIKQEVKLRKEEPTRDIISDDEENDEKAELGIEHLSTAEIDNRIKKMKRMRKSLDTKIMIWENARKAKDKKDKDEERRVERKEAQSDHEEDSENEKAKPTKRKIDAASPKRTSRRKKKRAKNT